MKSHLILSSCLALVLTYPALAQDATQSSTPAANNTQTQSSDPNHVEPMDKTPLYHVTVVERTARAVNYQHRGGATKINFKGTDLMPPANGEAKVESKQGYIEIEVEFDDINKPASSFGPEYMTYVMWAISPQGSAENLGEVLLNGNRSKLDVTTKLQAFALIVTAEPYFAVRTPSNLVVMENVIRSDTKGMPEVVDAKYELLERGEYQDDIREANLQPLVQGDRKVPLELLEARNAARIAQWSKANQYANDSFIRAQNLLEQAQRAQDQNAGANKKAVIRLAREAVQTFDDARILSLRRREEQRVATERRESEQREAAARAQAEQQQQLAQQAQQNAQLSQQTPSWKLSSASRRNRLVPQRSRLANKPKPRLSKLSRAPAGRRRSSGCYPATTATRSTDAASSTSSAASGAGEEADPRSPPRSTQPGAQTRDTARGLIVNMSDVLFDTGKATLRVGAREKLAKVAGILLAYPDLRLSLGGHTDSTGTLSFNQQLSQQRATAVRDYLVSQGLKTTEIVAVEGFGPSQPVASNTTPAGRQQNRRVEIVVAGDAIGNNVAPGASNGAVSAQQ